MLANELPELAREMETLLVQCGESELADQVWQLLIVDRCRCGDDFCASFYTVPPSDETPGFQCRTIDLPCETGMLILDVADDRIVFVEVLYRSEILQKITAILP